MWVTCTLIPEAFCCRYCRPLALQQSAARICEDNSTTIAEIRVNNIKTRIHCALTVWEVHGLCRSLSLSPASSSNLVQLQENHIYPFALWHDHDTWSTQRIKNALLNTDIASAIIETVPLTIDLLSLSLSRDFAEKQGYLQTLIYQHLLIIEHDTLCTWSIILYQKTY